VAHVRAEVLEESIASIIRVTRIGELGATLVVLSNVEINLILPFSYVTSCGPCKRRSFGGKYRLHHQGEKNRQARKNGSST
jgi:hypothetical protein